MVQLETRLMDNVSSSYKDIGTAQGFWNRSKNYIVGDSKIEQILSKATPEQRKKLESELESTTKKVFEEYGQKYFEKKPISTYARYLGGIASVGGSIATGFGLAGLILGGPITWGAAVAAGFIGRAVGAGINTAADLYDYGRLRYHLGKTEKIEDLGYMKKEKGIWQKIKSAVNKTPEGALAKGVATNALYSVLPGVIGGSTYAAEALGGAIPYAQAATMPASYVAYRQGQKKFQDVMIEYIKDKAHERFIKSTRAMEIANLPNIEVAQDKILTTPLRERLGKQVGHTQYEDQLYKSMNEQDAQRLSYKAPHSREYVSAA